MISPSPEFPITKPGMQLHRKREKPLRTYGQQRSVTSAPDTRSEPPAKRRKSSHQESPKSDGKSRTKEQTEDGTTKSDDTEKNEVAVEPVKPAKGSIQFYFKPQPVAKPVPTSNPQDEIQERTPSSPERPISRTRRGPRLLRIRPASLPDMPNDACQDEEDEEDSSGKENRTGKGKDSSTSKSTWRKKQPLSPSNDNTTNHAANSDSSLSEDTNRKPPKRAKATVQTTLNLSMSPAFAECKVCNFVYNPVHPDDVKYHKKHHTAVVRSNKRKREEAEAQAEADTAE